jgi:hypothetical protein
MGNRMSNNAESLAFRTAKKHVDAYSEESALMADHYEAMDCWDCEAFLQLAIDAFEWLMRADRAYRMSVYRGEREPDAGLEASLERLCEGWLNPCAFAETWVEKRVTKGYRIDNLAEFRQCAREMSAIVEAINDRGDESLPKGIAVFRNAAIEEHRNGETAEFV